MAAAVRSHGVVHLPPLELDTIDMDAALELGPAVRACAPPSVAAAARRGIGG